MQTLWITYRADSAIEEFVYKTLGGTFSRIRRMFVEERIKQIQTDLNQRLG